MASKDVNCFICKNLLQGSEVNEVKEKGLETFHKSISSQVYVIKESIARVLEGLKSIVVYDAY